jgi:hypothetical protein
MRRRRPGVRQASNERRCARAAVRERWRLSGTLEVAAARCHGSALVTLDVEDFSPQRFSFVRVRYAL